MMSLRERLESLDDLPNTYTQVLQKDIARVEGFIKECDKAISMLDESASVEAQIIALYHTLGAIPYIPDKNDTITTAATTVVLEKLVNQYKTQPTSPTDYLEMITSLKALRSEKLNHISDLQLKLAGEFASPLHAKLAEASSLHDLLSSYIAKINSK